MGRHAQAASLVSFGQHMLALRGDARWKAARQSLERRVEVVKGQLLTGDLDEGEIRALRAYGCALLQVIRVTDVSESLLDHQSKRLQSLRQKDQEMQDMGISDVDPNVEEFLTGLLKT